MLRRQKKPLVVSMSVRKMAQKPLGPYFIRPALLYTTHTGCAGCFSAFAALELYAEVFESLNALDKFEAFTSRNGAAFYGLPLNTETITLEKKAWTVPESYPFGSHDVVPLKAGQQLTWCLK